MRIEKKKGKEERRILIGMIVDPVILSRLYPKWQKGMFRSKWSNIIAGWCIKYYKKYEKAPMKNIESLYETWAEKYKDKNIINLVGTFLDSLSSEYKEMKDESNSNYIIDLAADYFNGVRMERLVESVQSNIDEGESDKAQNIITSYNRIEMGVGEGINVLQDSEAIKNAFESKKEPLITFPGALGKFFKGALEREGFISFMGKKAVGKSFWLMIMAYQGLLQRKRVAIFEVGDMGQNQIMRRLMIRASNRPISPCTIFFPTNIRYSKKRERVIVKHRRKVYEKGLSWRKAKEACQKVMKKKVKSKNVYLKLSCHFNSTLSVKGLQSILKNWERSEDWIPDIIIIDYADILNMEYPGFEGRDKINETWKQLRMLSQKYHCLLVTATQSDASSYDRNTMQMNNFSDDRRKIDSVTGMIGLNQTTIEKKQGIMRLNWVALRDDEFHTEYCVHVAGCLAIANPAIKSCF